MGPWRQAGSGMSGPAALSAARSRAGSRRPSARSRRRDRDAIVVRALYCRAPVPELRAELSGGQTRIQHEPAPADHLDALDPVVGGVQQVIALLGDDGGRNAEDGCLSALDPAPPDPAERRGGRIALPVGGK